MQVNVAFLQELLNSIAEQGRQLLPPGLVGGAREDIPTLVRALTSVRGEASGVAIARRILDLYGAGGDAERRSFFTFLASSLQPDVAAATTAAAAYAAEPSETTLSRLRHAVESPRRAFFERLNLAPGATAAIVAMRRDLLRFAKEDAQLAPVDADLRHLLASWFNRGFLVVRRIDWQTPAVILEKIIQYEAVHEIRGWDDLRRRLDPVDRRCFAFFHPSLVDEPLIFVEVALTNDVPASIHDVLDAAHAGQWPAGAPTTAVFYSISNCQDGLRGISFGNFLIKQVVEELAREIPQLRTFVTLSPAPRFAGWLARAVADDTNEAITDGDRATVSALADPAWVSDAKKSESAKAAVLALAARYFLDAKAGDGRPVDPVARFHLGNGARLERVNWMGDLSRKGLREAHGLMINYAYDLKEIERNHEAYANQGTIAASRGVHGLMRSPAKGKKVRTAS